MIATRLAACIATSMVMVVFLPCPTANGMENAFTVNVSVFTEHAEAGRVPEASVFRGQTAHLSAAWYQALNSRTGVGVSGNFALEKASWDRWDPTGGHQSVTATSKGMLSATVSVEKLFENAASDSQIRFSIRLPGSLGKSRRSLWNLPTAHAVPVIQTTWIVSKSRDPVLTYFGLTPSIALPQHVDGATYLVGHTYQVTAGVVHAITRDVSVGGSIDLNVKSRDQLDGSILPGTDSIGIWAKPTVTYAPTLQTQIEAGASVPLHAPDTMSLNVAFRWMPGR